MAKQAQVRIRGFPELERGSRKLFAAIKAGSPPAFAGVAGEVAATARGRVPVVSGALAASVTTVLKGDRATVGMGTGKSAEYAAWIEFGGKGRPFKRGGRYLGPPARAAWRRLKAEGENLARVKIRRNHWARPRP